MTFCVECGKPWGVILNRGERPSPEAADLARGELIDLLREVWECDYEPEELSACDWSKLPPIRATEVVFLTEALARFCDENGICDPCFLEDCWQDVDFVDIPRWLLKGRKRRWAYLWDCCNIGHLDNYVCAS